MNRRRFWTCLLACTLVSTVVSADAPEGQYTVHTDFVEDNRTGLVWQRQIDAESLSWADAKRYCELLTLQGRGWRLPSYKELLTIIDPTQNSPAIDRTAFPDTPRSWFWTASTYVWPLPAEPSANAWQVFFLDGTSIDAEVTKQNRVRCVR